VWTLDPRIYLSRYRPLSAYDRNDAYVDTSFLNTTENGSAEANIAWVRDTTLTSEIGTTGIIQANGRHESLTGSVSRSWQPTARWAMSGDASWARHLYMRSENSGLVNYRYASGAVQNGYSFSESSQLSLVLQGSQIEVPDGSIPRKTSLAAQLKLSTALTEQWKLVMSIGPSRIRSRNQSSSGTVFNLSSTHSGELTAWTAAYSRAISPTGLGTLSQQDQLTLNISRPLTERWSVSGSVLKIKTADAITSSGQTYYSSDYTDVNAAVSWRATPQWNVTLSADRVEQRAGSNDPARALGNRASLGFQWNGLTRTLD
jgi:hypothetical protein